LGSGATRIGSESFERSGAGASGTGVGAVGAGAGVDGDVRIGVAGIVEADDGKTGVVDVDAGGSGVVVRGAADIEVTGTVTGAGVDPETDAPGAGLWLAAFETAGANSVGADVAGEGAGAAIVNAAT